MQAIEEVKADLSVDLEFLQIAKLPNGFDYLGESANAIAEQLFDLRGFLHHHSGKNSSIWHPSRQRTFRADAVFLHTLVGKILIKKATRILFTKDVSETFAAIRMTATDGRVVRFKPFVNEEWTTRG